MKDMIGDLEHQIVHVSKQVRMMHDQVLVATHLMEAFNERWAGIEDELRADLKRTRDKIDALAASRDLLSLSRDRSPPETKPATREIFLD